MGGTHAGDMIGEIDLGILGDRKANAYRVPRPCPMIVSSCCATKPVSSR